MKPSTALILITFILSGFSTVAANQPVISGDYLEARSCDVFTGPCFANAEMGVTGKEAILVWAVRDGSWNKEELSGLSVVAVVRTDDTLGDLQYQPREGKAVLIVDERANESQREALTSLARAMAGDLIEEVVQVSAAPMNIDVGNCTKSGGCASAKVGDLVEISTRCFGGKDHLCGNEEVFYPPLTAVHGAYPAFTEVASFQGAGLDATWQNAGQRSAFIAKFTR